MTLEKPRNATAVESVLLLGEPQEVAASKAKVSQPTVSRILGRFKRDFALTFGKAFDQFPPEARRTLIQQLLGNAEQARPLLAN